MKRRLTILGIFLGLGLAVVLVVIATQQPVEKAALRNGFTLTTNNELVVRSRYEPTMTIIAHLPKTNSAATSKSGN